MNPKQIALASITALTLGISSIANAQNTNVTGQQYSAISTGVPFLTISPDARSGAMGDVGIALSPDANAQHWNVGKIAHAKEEMGLSVTYTPWLSQLTQDMFVGYVSGYMKFGEKKDQAISASLRYFNIGQIDYTTIEGNPAGSGKPNEFAFDLGYSRKLSENLSLGVALRYINSNIAQGAQTAGSTIKPANAVAGDLGLYYTKTTELDGDKAGTFNAGLALTNVGSRVTYSQTVKDFLPAQLGLGVAYTYKVDRYNKVTGALDVRKTLVAASELDADGRRISDPRQDYTVISGMLNSFGNAPGGYGTNIALGGEYWYQDMFAVRAGYFYEHPDNGARQYFTCGIGVKYNVFGLNFSYLVPAVIHTNSFIDKTLTNPLANTMRFSLTFDFASMDDLKKK